MKKIQIGVMGSAADLQYSKELEQLAFDVGVYVAKHDCILIYGAEKDYDSLSTAAARGAFSVGGLTVGVTYGTKSDIFDSANASVIIPCGLERGGGREYVLVSACDVIITISDGSGTLNEMTIAYQLNRPIVAISDTGGWSQKLENEFIDARKRFLVQAAATPEEAVALAIKSVK